MIYLRDVNVWLENFDIESIILFLGVYSQLQRQVENFSDKAECANADLKADMDRWHKHKRKDIKEVLVDIAEKQAKKYEEVKDNVFNIG